MKPNAITDISSAAREGWIRISRVPRPKKARLVIHFSSGTKWEIVSAPDGDAPRNGITKVIAKDTPRGVEYISARTGRRLTPPKKR